MFNKTTSTVASVFHRGLIITGAVIAAFALQAEDAQQKKQYTSSKGDTASCLKEAAQMNNATIKVAEIAAQKAQNQELKQFSQQLQRDHQQAQEKLESIAKQHNVTLPTSLDQDCTEKVAKLQSLSGSEFDKEFARCAIQGHAMAVTKLKEASTDAKDSDVAEYTKNMLSKVKQHQEKAREVAKAVGLDQSTIASLESQAASGVGTSGSTSQSERGASSSDSSDSPKEESTTQP